MARKYLSLIFSYAGDEKNCKSNSKEQKDYYFYSTLIEFNR